MKYLILLVPIIFLFSCKKETMIKVHIENVATGAPYVDQLVYIRENPQNVNQENTTVYEGYTDSEGKLMIDFKYKRNAKYFIFISLPESYCYIHSLSYPINKEKTNDIHFRLAPCAQLKLKIQNVNCQGPGDNLKLYYIGREVPGQEMLDGQLMSEHDGCVNVESDNFISYPMGRRYYRWEVTRSGTTEVFQDTIYLEENEQRVYEILY
ncbi:MAG: hypothetical protein WEA99_02145 [Brumimicrobium sp.]